MSRLAGAAQDDLRMRLMHFRLFSKCAVVGDSELIRGTTQFIGSLMPMPVESFKNEHVSKSIEWVALAMDGLLPELLTKVGSHFVRAKVK